MLHALSLINAAQRIILDHGLTVWGSKGVALYHVQSAYEELCGRYMAVDDGHLFVSKDFTYTKPTSPETKAFLNLPWWFETVKFVELLDSNGSKRVNCYPLDMVLAADAEYGSFSYHFRGSRLAVDNHNAPSGTVATVRVNAYREPAQLVVFKPSAATATTVTFPTEAYQENPNDPLGRIFIEDGYYDNTQWIVVSGPGQGTTFEIGSFASMVGTLLDGTTFLAANTLTSESIVAMVPSLPGRSHRIIPWIAAGEGSMIEENVTAASLIRNKTKTLWEDFENTMTVRQIQASRTFHPQD